MKRSTLLTFFGWLALGLSAPAVYSAPKPAKLCHWEFSTFAPGRRVDRVDPSDRLALENIFRKSFHDPDYRLSVVEDDYIRDFHLEEPLATTRQAGAELLRRRRRHKLATQATLGMAGLWLGSLTFPLLSRKFRDYFAVESLLNEQHGLNLQDNEATELRYLQRVLKTSSFNGRNRLIPREISGGARTVPDLFGRLLFKGDPAERRKLFNVSFKLWRDRDVLLNVVNAEWAGFEPGDLDRITTSLGGLDRKMTRLMRIHAFGVGDTTKTVWLPDVDNANNSEGSVGEAQAQVQELSDEAITKLETQLKARGIDPEKEGIDLHILTSPEKALEMAGETMLKTYRELDRDVVFRKGRIIISRDWKPSDNFRWGDERQWLFRRGLAKAMRVNPLFIRYSHLFLENQTYYPTLRSRVSGVEYMTESFACYLTPDCAEEMKRRVPYLFYIIDNQMWSIDQSRKLEFIEESLRRVKQLKGL